MKAFWKKAIAVLLCAALLPVSLMLAAFSMPKYYSDTYYAELSDYYSRLKTTEGKRIIVLGGSSVAFGLNGAMMEEILSKYGYDYTVCPFGLYAAVGTAAMVELCRGQLREGDIVILAIEPSEETFSTYFGATAFWKCAESDKSLIEGLNSSQKSALVGNFTEYLQDKCRIFRTGDIPVSNDVYAKSSFDMRCDMIYDRAGNTMLVGYDPASVTDLGTVGIQQDFAEEVNTFCAEAREAGAIVVTSFAPMNELSVQVGDSEISRYFDLLMTTFDAPVISDVYSYILPAGWFYDSNVHLNSAGAILRTGLLCEDILAYLGYYGKVEYDVPEMPESIAAVADEVGDAAGLSFVKGDGEFYLLSGVEAGITSVTVPSFHDSLPVVGYTERAFEGSDVEELTLPESVLSLQSRGLEGSKIKRLVLRHTGTPPTVYEDSFYGVDGLKIYVPAASLYLYRDGAGCEVNEWEPYLDMISTY